MTDILPFLKNYKTNSLGLVYKSIVDSQVESVDQDKAERAQRLAGLFESDVWRKDLVPILTQLYDDYLEAVKAKTVSPDTLKVIDDFLTHLDGKIQVGAEAMRRLAERRLKGQEIQRQVDAVNTQTQIGLPSLG